MKLNRLKLQKKYFNLVFKNAPLEAITAYTRAKIFGELNHIKPIQKDERGNR